MEMIWTAIDDDSLSWVDKTVEFLQTEFCPADADPIWSSGYFEWKLGSAHPAGRGYMSIAVCDGRVVGTSSLTCKRLLIDGVEVIGGEVGDSYRSATMNLRGRPGQLSTLDRDPKSYINKSIFGRLASDVRRRAEADGLTIIYGTPNKNAYPSWIKRLGYFDAQCRLRTYTRPTTRWLLGKKPSLIPVRGIIKGVEDFSILLQRSVCRQIAGRDLVISEVIPPSVDIDLLWNKVRPTSGFALVRDAVYWRHRYLQQPLAKYDFHCLHERDKLIGIMVTRRVSVGQGRSVLYVMEWMFDGKDTLLRRALAEIVAKYRHLDVDAFSLWARESGEDAREVKRSLFFSKAGSNSPIILADTTAARRLKNNFQFYLGSSDAV